MSERAGQDRELPEPPPQSSALGRLIVNVARRPALQTRLEHAREYRVVDAALAVVQEDNEIGGGILAGALAYRLFLFLLPLALLLIAMLGIVAGAFHTTPRSVGKDAGLVGLVTNDVSAAADGRSRVWVALSALVVLAYATRVLYRSVRVVHALAWEHSAATAKRGSKSLKLFALALAALVTLSAAGGTIDEGTVTKAILVSMSLLLVTSALWLGVEFLLPHSTARWHDLVPGAVAFGVGMLAIHGFDVYLLGFVHRSRSNAYGTLGVAATALLSLFLIGRLVVAAAVLNATLFRRSGEN